MPELTPSADTLPGLVIVTANARLHMGFVDMNGGLGRRFGSIGLALMQPVTRLRARRADGFNASGPGAARALVCARQFAASLALPDGVDLILEEAIPAHAGLGSGTQLALAVGVALARLHGLALTPREVAALTARGGRSGIGIGAFEKGGLLLDGGRGPQTVVPPLLARLDFPLAWRVLLIFDHAAKGVHGGHEAEAFRALPEFPAELAATLCRRALMQALPAVAEQDLPAFGEAIHEIQCRVGDHFAAAQGGGRYTSAAVGSVLDWLRQQGVACVGQSSWGPTGFAVLDNEASALEMRGLLETRYAGQDSLSFMLCRASNQGGAVQQFYQDGSAPAEP